MAFRIWTVLPRGCECIIHMHRADLADESPRPVLWYGMITSYELPSIPTVSFPAYPVMFVLCFSLVVHHSLWHSANGIRCQQILPTFVVILSDFFDLTLFFHRWNSSVTITLTCSLKNSNHFPDLNILIISYGALYLMVPAGSIPVLLLGCQ